jgi:hypothetical protein
MRRAGVMVGLAILLSGGCRTPPPGSPATTVPPPPVLLTVGRVLNVNAARGYVVVECGSLPSPGEEAKVFRSDEVVARLRISGPSRPPFVTADIVDGQPQPGDTVKVLRKRGAAAPNRTVKP